MPAAKVSRLWHCWHGIGTHIIDTPCNLAKGGLDTCFVATVVSHETSTHSAARPEQSVEPASQATNKRNNVPRLAFVKCGAIRYRSEQ